MRLKAKETSWNGQYGGGHAAKVEERVREWHVVSVGRNGMVEGSDKRKGKKSTWSLSSHRLQRESAITWTHPSAPRHPHPLHQIQNVSNSMCHHKIKAQHLWTQTTPRESAPSLIPSKLANSVTFRTTRRRHPVQRLVEKSRY